MTPPEAPVTGNTPEVTSGPPAVFACPVTLTKRADFLRAARAKRQATKGLILQARKRAPDEGDPDLIRVGYTCSKKVGNAVKRNRAKRRLRAIAREVICAKGQPGWDYVLIGRAGATVDRPYIDLVGDLAYALKVIHGKRK
ncbi:ribonuclease P protein component [Profundibacter sp.]